jgi:hypothetical protein
MDIFSQYEREYTTLLDSIKQKINSADKQHYTSLSREFEEMDEIVLLSLFIMTTVGNNGNRVKYTCSCYQKYIKS